jgi:four helix bundle protein
MVAKQFEELDAWQLANELKEKVVAILATSPAKRDAEYCDQIRRSTKSSPANIAEGFGYYEHPQFARHVRIAIASLDETKNHLTDGISERFWTADQIHPLILLVRRARAASVGLLKHLTTTRAPTRWKKPERNGR